MEPKKSSFLLRPCESSDEDFDEDQFAYDFNGLPVPDGDHTHGQRGSPYPHDEDYKGPVPKQPMELLPSWGDMPDDLRQKIYRLLESSFQNGVELKAFRDSFTKHYSSSISNNRDCHMQYDEMFYCLTDILEIMIDDGGKMWLKPRTRSEIRRLHAQKPPEIFTLDPVFSVRRLSKREEYLTRNRPGYRPPHSRPSRNPQPSTTNHDAEPSLAGGGSAPWADQLRIDPSRNGLIKHRVGVDDLTSGGASSTIAADRPYDGDDFGDDENQRPCGSGYGSGPATVTANGIPRFPDMKVNKNAFERIVRSNQRSNNSSVQKMQKSAALNIEMWENMEFVESTEPCGSSTINPQDRRVELEIKNIQKLNTNLWIPNDDISNYYLKAYGRPLTFPDCYGKNVFDLLEKFPELFALDKHCNAKVRPEPEKDGEVPESAEAITAFGIQEGDVFTGPYKCLQLVEDEWIHVLISEVKNDGDFYVQFKDMDGSFNYMDIDLSEFYENPFKSEKYAVPDCLSVGLPVVVSCKDSWRRAKILAINSDEVFVILVDFGHCGWLARKDVRLLQSSFSSDFWPPFAVLVGLNNICPASTDRQAVLVEMLSHASKNAKSLSIIIQSRRPKDGVVLVDLIVKWEDGSKVSMYEEAEKRGLTRSEPSVQQNDLNRPSPPLKPKGSTYPLLPNRFSDSDFSNPDNLAVEPFEPAQPDQPCSSTESNLTKSVASLSVNARNSKSSPQTPVEDSMSCPEDQPSASSGTPLMRLNPDVAAILNLLYAKLNDPDTPHEDKDVCRRQIEAIIGQQR